MNSLLKNRLFRRLIIGLSMTLLMVFFAWFWLKTIILLGIYPGISEQQWEGSAYQSGLFWSVVLVTIFYNYPGYWLFVLINKGLTSKWIKITWLALSIAISTIISGVWVYSQYCGHTGVHAPFQEMVFIVFTDLVIPYLVCTHSARLYLDFWLKKEKGLSS